MAVLQAGAHANISTIYQRKPKHPAYTNWEFSTVRHWGEHSNGEWTLRIENVNEIHNEAEGELVQWTLKLNALYDPHDGMHDSLTHSEPWQTQFNISVA
jgi:subtilisin-like proprotein convertase family protein